MLFKAPKKLSVVQAKEDILTDYQSGSKWIHEEVMFFFSVGETATSKWTHGEVTVFGSVVYKIFALKCQKLLRA